MSKLISTTTATQSLWMNNFLTACLFIAGLLLVPAAAHAATPMKDFPVVRMQSLDKVTARTETFEAKVGTTIQFGPLFIRIQSCRKTDPIDKPESAAFIQVWEVPPETGKSEWVFSGWMFASSPALSAMDHPVYDVWVLDCLDQEKPNKAAAESETEQENESQEELDAVEEGPEPATDAE